MVTETHSRVLKGAARSTDAVSRMARSAEVSTCTVRLKVSMRPCWGIEARIAAGAGDGGVLLLDDTFGEFHERRVVVGGVRVDQLLRLLLAVGDVVSWLLSCWRFPFVEEASPPTAD